MTRWPTICAHVIKISTKYFKHALSCLWLGSFAENPSFLATATYDEIDNGDWSKQQHFYRQLSFHASCNMSSHRPFHRDYFPTKGNHRELMAWGIIINRNSWTALISGYHRHYQASARSLKMHCCHYMPPPCLPHLVWLEVFISCCCCNVQHIILYQNNLPLY